jgi:DNA-binding NtrC family response regulator
MEPILIVDDDKDFRFNLSAILRDAEYDVRTASNGRQAIKEVAQCVPSITLLDFHLPDMDGMKVIEEIRKIDQSLLIIMITAYGDVRSAVSAMKMGVFDYVAKPFDDEELLLIIKKALESRSLTQEVKRLRRRLGEIEGVEDFMGSSPRIQQIFKQIEIIAPTNLTVIIQGASGTGKELIARRIHCLSQRCDRPFVAVDCGALPETLMESEFFGYEKGAFTGANGRKEGRFEQANGGTLFLDEITNLSEALQGKLLRVVQERKLQHLGGQKEISIDVRILVASNVLLSERVRQGNFREDLYHRLNEFEIEAPRLTERMEDIPIFAEYFLKEANSEFFKSVKGFSPKAMRCILNYDWPGNIREFKNVIKRAALLAESDTIELDHLSINLRTPASPMLEGSKLPENRASFEEMTQNFEKEVIMETLRKVEGKKAKAAQLLGLNKKTLYRKIKSLNI